MHNVVAKQHTQKSQSRHERLCNILIYKRNLCRKVPQCTCITVLFWCEGWLFFTTVWWLLYSPFRDYKTVEKKIRYVVFENRFTDRSPEAWSPEDWSGAFRPWTASKSLPRITAVCQKPPNHDQWSRRLTKYALYCFRTFSRNSRTSPVDLRALDCCTTGSQSCTKTKVIALNL